MTQAIRAPLVAALLSAAAFPAASQDSAGGLSYRGFVEIEYLNGEGIDDFFGVTDMAFSTSVGGSGFGIDFGLHALATQDDTFHAIYGAVNYTAGPNKFSIGVPRPVGIDLIDEPAIGGIETLDVLELGFLSGNLVDLLYLANDEVPLGLRYDGEFGALRLGASVHHFDDADLSAVNLAFTYEISDFTIYGSYETIDELFEMDTKQIGVMSDFGRYGGGLSYTSRDVLGPNIDGTRAWLSYEPTSEITVEATAYNTNVIDLYGLNLEYQHPTGIYGQIGAVDGRSVDAIYDVSLGFRF